MFFELRRDLLWISPSHFWSTLKFTACMSGSHLKGITCSVLTHEAKLSASNLDDKWFWTVADFAVHSMVPVLIES